MQILTLLIQPIGSMVANAGVALVSFPSPNALSPPSSLSSTASLIFDRTLPAESLSKQQQHANELGT